MEIFYNLIFLCLISFIIGAIPTAYLAGRIFKGLDIRQHGSGNVGATNAFRVLGKKIGFFVFFIDFLKGFIPSFLLSKLIIGDNLDAGEVGLWIGVSAILGHVFTPFLGFKGGKGVATGAGVLCGSFPLLFLCVTSIWIVLFKLTRTVSISSLSSLISLVLLSLFFKQHLSVTAIFLGVCLFTFWTHRENIQRLIEGKEHKINR